MKNPKKIFHIISYLQYPLMIASIVFYVPFIISIAEKNPDWNKLNYVLILLGVALSFSTLQDTTKTQNKFSRKIWENPVKGKIALIFISISAFAFIAIGLFNLYFSKTDSSENLAVGITVLGIGLVGLLKSAIELFENHRTDKKY